MVKTKRICDPPEASDGERFLVNRGKPPFRSWEELSLCGWLKCLGPSKELLQDWREKKISWEEYKSRYLEEMSGQGQREKIQELAGRASRGTMTLLCFEPEDEPHCHRHLLRRLIERAMANRPA